MPSNTYGVLSAFSLHWRVDELRKTYGFPEPFPFVLQYNYCTKGKWMTRSRVIAKQGCALFERSKWMTRSRVIAKQGCALFERSKAFLRLSAWYLNSNNLCNTLNRSIIFYAAMRIKKQLRSCLHSLGAELYEWTCMNSFFNASLLTAVSTPLSIKIQSQPTY